MSATVFFRISAADDLADREEFLRHFDRAVPASLLPNVTVEPMRATEGELPARRRAADVLLIGSDERFWNLRATAESTHPTVLPADDEIVLNEPLAEELGVGTGDRVVIRLPSADRVPADSPLGHKENRVRSVADLEVVDIVPATGLGRFRLRSSQSQPRNAYVSLNTVSRALDQKDKANALLVSANGRSQAMSAESTENLRQLLSLGLGDYGLALDHIQRTFAGSRDLEPVTIADFYQITQDRMVFDDATAAAIRSALEGQQLRELFTYLATSIRKSGNGKSRKGDIDAADEAGIPYSTVTAVDAQTASELLHSATGDVTSTLEEDEIILNSWAADDLSAQLGDFIELSYFEPETTHDQPRERTARFRLKAIVPLTEPAEGYRRSRPAVFQSQPTIANDPEMTPTVEGVTDEDSIGNWDPPFPFDQSRVRDTDDTYWENHRTTPKAFISLRAGQRLWRSRFGQTTSFRVMRRETPRDPDVSAEVIRSAVLSKLRASSRSFVFTPVKSNAVAASSGTTPFEFLFLGFSMFLIASALMLVALLFRLGLEVRATELGVLRAVGFDVRQIKTSSLRETGIVALVGAVIGGAVGVLYAWLMLVGLRTWWLDAIVTPFLELHVSPFSIPLGCLLGVLSGLSVVWASLRRLKDVPPRQLLGGTLSDRSPPPVRAARKPRTWLIGLLLLAAIASGITAAQLRGEAQAGGFFGCGALVLIASLLAMIAWLRNLGHHRNSRSQLGLFSLSARAATRRPTRSALTTSLMASACFLIIAISAFRLAPSTAGTGGFDWLLESGRPIHADLTDKDSLRRQLGDAAVMLADANILPIRVQDGDDASCRNLYRSARPRILGVSPVMIEFFDDNEGFAWAASAAATATQRANPWRLLDSPFKADPKPPDPRSKAGEAETTDFETGGPEIGESPIPVVLDKNTAMYSLQLYGGIGQEFTFTYDRVGPVTFKVVGLVANSILQGNLLVSESDLLARFPEISGYRMFLLKTPTHAKEAARLLETRFGDLGLDARSTTELLADLMAVQNTYLSTFQSLGALGLLLGVVGLAIAQTRNVLERRSEFALLQSVGFTRKRLGRLVLAENGVLMLMGLGIGTLAALITVLPHVLIGGAQIPWGSLGRSLLAVLGAGLTASFITVRAAASAPLIAALRGD